MIEMKYVLVERIIVDVLLVALVKLWNKDL